MSFKPIITDLYVKLAGLKVDDVERILRETKDDLWVERFIKVVLEDFKNLQYGMSGPDWVTVRELAVHAFNRHAYYVCRINGDKAIHQMLDSLYTMTSPMEGSLPTYIAFEEGGLQVREQLGRFDFASYIHYYPELFKECWAKWGYPLQSRVVLD